MNLLIRLLISAISAFILGKLLSGVHFDSFGASVIFALVLGILNTVVRPVLKLLSLPVTLLTLGLFSLVINALMVMLADYFMADMHIESFISALVFSILLSLLTSVLVKIFEQD